MKITFGFCLDGEGCADSVPKNMAKVSVSEK
jgi:hypothetical protein